MSLMSFSDFSEVKFKPLKFHSDADPKSQFNYQTICGKTTSYFIYLLIQKFIATSKCSWKLREGCNHGVYDTENG